MYTPILLVFPYFQESSIPKFFLIPETKPVGASVWAEEPGTNREKELFITLVPAPFLYLLFQLLSYFFLFSETLY